MNSLSNICAHASCSDANTQQGMSLKTQRRVPVQPVTNPMKTGTDHQRPGCVVFNGDATIELIRGLTQS